METRGFLLVERGLTSVDAAGAVGFWVDANALKPPLMLLRLNLANPRGCWLVPKLVAAEESTAVF